MRTLWSWQIFFHSNSSCIKPCISVSMIRISWDSHYNIFLFQRKLLAIYLHHDNSILSNVFCSQILCSDSVVSYLSNNFVTWAWDLTLETKNSRWDVLLYCLSKKACDMRLLTNTNSVRWDVLLYCQGN